LDWLSRSFAAVEHPDPATEATALRMLGLLSERRQKLAEARDYQSRAVEIYRRLGDRVGEARSLNNLALVARSAGRPEESEQLLRQAIAIRGHGEDPVGMASSMNNLALLLTDQGRWGEAIALLEKTLEDRAGGDDWVLAACTLNLALALLMDGRDGEAVAHARDALRWLVEFADNDGIIESLELTMAVAVRRGEGLAGARLAGAAEAARAAFSIHGYPADEERYEGWIAELRSSLDPKDLEQGRTEGRAMTLAQAADYALHEVLGETSLHGDGPASSR
jgi:tetratricopeptide (TPR) repeat protein